MEVGVRALPLVRSPERWKRVRRVSGLQAGAPERQLTRSRTAEGIW